MEATAASPWACAGTPKTSLWACAGTPKTLQYQSLTSVCSIFFFFYSEESWKRVHGFVHTGIYSDTVLQTNIHGEVQVEEWTAKVTTAAESIWAVVYANIKIPSMNLELLLNLWRVVPGIHWPLVQKPSARASDLMETWLWTIWVAEVSCRVLNCLIVIALAIS